MRAKADLDNMRQLVTEYLRDHPAASLSQIRRFLADSGYSGVSQSTLVAMRRREKRPEPEFQTTLKEVTLYNRYDVALYNRYVQLRTYVLGGHLDAVRSKMDELYQELKKHGSKRSKTLWMKLLEAIQEDAFIQDLEKEDGV